MTVSYAITATAAPTTTPPSVRLTVTATGSPQPAQVHLQRVDADGVARPVRSPYGSVLPVSAGSALVYDREYRYGTNVTYQVTEDGGAAAAAFSMSTITVPWLIHPGRPSLSVPLTLRKGAAAEESWALEQGLFPVLGDPEPIVITGGARRAPASTLIAEVDSPAERDAMRALLADGSALLLNVPTALNLGIDTAYIAVDAARALRQSDIGDVATRDIQLPYQVVRRPGGAAQAPVTWDMIFQKYGPWTGIPSGKTWKQLEDPLTY